MASWDCKKKKSGKTLLRIQHYFRARCWSRKRTCFGEGQRRVPYVALPCLSWVALGNLVTSLSLAWANYSVTHLINWSIYWESLIHDAWVWAPCGTLLGRGQRPQCGEAVGMEGGWSQGRGPKLSPERCYSFWGQRKRPEAAEKKPHKGRRETSRE